MPEILAPCGGKDSFFAAINNYADAVYLGLDDFSARKNADNFSTENIGYYVAYAHMFGVKVYVCVNTIVKDSELEKYFEVVKCAYLAQVDAFIVQDIFLGKKLKEAFPKITLHLSTQAGVNNTLGAKIAKDFGFSRVILARETGLSEIECISKIIETEIFVHGALCSSFSGHCYMSSFIGGNSGNRGFCRQPCRQKYAYSFNKKQCFALSLSDLCLAGNINELAKLGISSFKIEGRMRSAEYVGSAVRLYRKALNGGNFENELSQAKRNFNRGNYTSGYVFGEDKNLLSSSVQGHLGEFIEKIAKLKGDKIVLSKQFFKDSGFKILRGDKEVGSAKCLCDGNEIAYSGDVKKGDSVFVTKDMSLSEVNTPKRVKEIEVEANFFAGQKANLRSGDVVVFSDNILDEAKNVCIDEATVLENLSRTDIYPFVVKKLKFDGNSAFMTKSELNKLRKRLYEKLFYGERKSAELITDQTFNHKRAVDKKVESRKIAVAAKSFLGDFDGKITDYIFTPRAYEREEIKKFLAASKSSRASKYLYLPAFMTDIEISKIKELISDFDGFYIENIFGLELAKSLGKETFGGVELNVFNGVDEEEMAKIGVKKYCVSKELSYDELAPFDGYVFALGSVKLMSLVYCPNGRKCVDCKITDSEKLVDWSGRVFPVRRYKTGNCRFEIFNESILISKRNFDKMFFDFSGLDEGLSRELLDDYFNHGFDFMLKKYKHTSGNLSKGIL